MGCAEVHSRCAYRKVFIIIMYLVGVSYAYRGN